MKTRIIIFLFVLVLIIATVLFFLMYNNSADNGDNSKVLSGSINTDTSIKKVDEDILSLETNSFKEADFDFNSETVIELEDNNTTIDGTNVKIDGNTVYITAAGAYRITGKLNDGRIIVNAPKENVKLILDNVSVTCSYSSAIYVYKSSATMIYLNEGTTNSLADGSLYNYNDEFSSEEDEEPNATLYSKSDLIIYGKGNLIVKGNFNNGITSKDTLYIKDAVINVDSKNHGINGKDNFTSENATIKVTSGGDGIRSTNDKDDNLGWIRIIDSIITVDSEEDAIQAETDLIIDGGTFNIVAGGGTSSSNKVDNSMPGREMWGRNITTNSSDERSMKGLKASRYLMTTGNAIINIDSADDAIHSNASVQIYNGTFSIKTGDDGIHADNTLTIDDGTITITESYEGLEGNNIVINDGEIDITSSDDGINVNGGKDNSGFGGFGSFGGNLEIKDNKSSENTSKTIESSDIDLITTATDRGGKGFPGKERPGDGNNLPEKPEFGGESNEIPNLPERDGNTPPQEFTDTQKSSESSYKLIINGGDIIVRANGDGIDSNGSIEMNGGNVAVQGPTSSMNGAIDYENSFTLNGGSIIAIGASGMAQGVKSESQASIMVTLENSQPANTKIEIRNEEGKVIFETTSDKSFNNIVASSKDIELDNTYSIYINGNLSTTTIATLNTSNYSFGGFGGMRGR